MKKFFKLTFTAFLLLFFGYIVYLNIALYYKPSFTQVERSTINTDFLHQLQFLEKEMHNGAADEMQNTYPEGFVFMHSLYGLSWAELAGRLHKEDTLRKTAIEEINYSILEISSPKGTAVFPNELPLPYGAFYNGWLNYLRGKYLALQNDDERDGGIAADFKAGCKRIAAALDSSDTPYLESYYGMAWPADNMLCIASLALHDKIFKREYKERIDAWIEKAEKRTDALGLIPHSCFALTGKVREPARGSSQSLMLNFLIEIDPAYAQKKFAIYKEHFIDHRFGLPGIREYPEGQGGNGDIDSGPVIFDIGGAASIVGQRTMQRYDEAITYIALRNSIEAFGMGDDEDEGKQYLFGALPVADAFIAWSNSVEASKEIVEATSWLGKFHLYSALVLLVTSCIILWIWKRAIFKPKSKPHYNSNSQS